MPSPILAGLINRTGSAPRRKISICLETSATSIPLALISSTSSFEKKVEVIGSLPRRFEQAGLASLYIIRPGIVQGVYEQRLLKTDLTSVPSGDKVPLVANI
jgi:hypothetical protein